MKNFIVSVVILVCLGFVMPSVVQSAPFGWKTEKNKTYHFKINYPANIVPLASFATTYFSSAAQWTGLENIKKSLYQKSLLVLPVANLKYQDANGQAYYKLFVRVGVSRATSDINNCLLQKNTAQQGVMNITKIIIENVPFYQASFTDAAMGQSYHVQLYRTLHHRACYSLDITSVGSNNSVPKHIQSKIIKAEALAKQVINSFRFLKFPN